jgi:hypothetical protein
MTAMAGTARFLGGRPPFGYRLVPTGVAHPNPDKARWGIQLQRLEPDPRHAPVVRRIFAWRLEGVGYRTIAARLDAAGIASPSASDPARNQHRRQAGWSIGALQAICANPRYMGTETWGRVQKTEVLIDPTTPAAGHITRRRRPNDGDFISVPDPSRPSSRPKCGARPKRPLGPTPITPPTPSPPNAPTRFGAF